MTHQLSDPATWLEQHGDSLFRYALARLGDRRQAEDLVQDTLVAALESRHRYAGTAQERTWLTGIMKHKVIDLLRVRHRETPTDFDPDAPTPEERSHFDQRGSWMTDVQPWSNPDGALQQDEFLAVLDRCIDDLPDRAGHAFRLRELHGLETDEICEALGIGTANNLWVVLSRARLRLRDCLNRSWFQSTDREVETC